MRLMRESVIPGGNFYECIFSVFAHAQLLGTDKFFEVFLVVGEYILERPGVVHGVVVVADLKIVG